MTNKLILIVDDDTAIRRIVQISLKALTGWEVLEASSGETGLAIAQAEVPDVILLDVMMPEMDGVTTLLLMKAHPVVQSIPVIFLTAKAQLSEQKQFAQLAIAGVITKPFKATELVQQMRSILNWN